MKLKHSTVHMIIAALCLALCLVLPFLTGGIPEIGKMLLPMHLGVFICAYVSDYKWATVVGFIAPLMRSFLFGTPYLYPTAIAMAFELACYGFVAGFLNQKLKASTIDVYISLLSAMVAGRIVSGLMNMILYGLKGNTYSWSLFIGASFLNAIPGIILQLIVVPLLVISLRKARVIDKPHHHDHVH